jgi:predicted  nucleic acid-binding Zn-ribbon protein
MTARNLSPALDPATVEENQLRARIDSLREELATAVADLEQLRTTLTAFESRYDARIGVLMVAVDRAELQAAVFRRRITALQESIEAWQAVEETIEREFAAERERVEAEARDASGARRRAAELPTPPSPEVAAAIRTQYRKLARKFHPDVAAGDEQRAQHEVVMRRVNVAMEMNDLGTLLDLELEMPATNLDAPGPTRGARIAWSTAEIARLEEALAKRIGELAALRATSLHQLWQRIEREPSLLDRLESDLRAELATAEMERHALAHQYDDLVRQHAAGSD